MKRFLYACYLTFVGALLASALTVAVIRAFQGD